MHLQPKRGRLNCRRKYRKWKILGAVFLIIAVLFLLLMFVVFPLVFMNDIKLQRLLMFMNINLPSSPEYFQSYKLDGLRNLYVPITQSDDSIIYLGVWHILPHNLTNQSITDNTFDYDDALLNSNFSVLLNFHGAGEARSYFIDKNDVFREFFHVINFDYRSFADSSKAKLSEDSVVYDCVELYKWLLFRTNSPIFIWSHSLGTALAARTVSVLQTQNILPSGLFLESGFTVMREELPVHPYGKCGHGLLKTTGFLQTENGSEDVSFKFKMSDDQCHTLLWILLEEDAEEEELLLLNTRRKNQNE